MDPTDPTPVPLDAADEGVRLDRVLGRHLKLSRRQVRRLLESGAVLVNQRRLDLCDKGLPIRPGDRLDVLPFDRPAGQRPIAQPELVMDVLSRGDGWMMVNKPPGVAVHPLRPDECGTVLNAVIARHPEVFGVGEGGLRSGVVHRLDIGTSGTLLLALDPDRWDAFRDAFRSHRTVKRYLALVRGQVLAPDTVTLPLVVARHSPAIVRVTGGDGRLCSLSYAPVETLPEATLLEVHLDTGFLHQIRVMLAHLGHPVLGDATYGRSQATIPRPMLHAAALRCEDANGSCDPPGDFQELLRRLRVQ